MEVPVIRGCCEETVQTKRNWIPQGSRWVCRRLLRGCLDDEEPESMPAPQRLLAAGVSSILTQIWSRFHRYQKGSKGPPHIKISSCKSCREKYSVSTWPFCLVLHSHFDFYSLQTSTSTVKTRIPQHWLRWIAAKDCSLPLSSSFSPV